MSRQGYHYWSVLRSGTKSGRRLLANSRKGFTKRRSFSLEALEPRNLLAADPGDADPYAALASAPPVFTPELIEQIRAANAALGGGGGIVTDPFVPSQAFNLHSLPGATKTIYLDFDGHLTRNTAWNTDFSAENILTPALSLDEDLTSFAEEERMLIYNIWRRVSEDFLPFEVNVTTQDPGVEAFRNTGEGDEQWGIRVVVGGSTLDWYTPITERGVGGVAYINSFNDDIDQPAFTFGADYVIVLDPENPYEFVDITESFIAETISHEVGHTLGLTHDGQIWPVRDVTDADEDGEPDDPNKFVQVPVEYYAGHGLDNNLPTSWGPIMGGGAGVLTQWSKGEYFWANNIQDDLAIIVGNNGFGYRNDDHGSSIVDASNLTTVNDPVDQTPDVDGQFFFEEGIIEQNDDVDYFEFEVIGLGEWFTFDITPFARGANLDILATIRDAAGTELYRSNPRDYIGGGTQTFGTLTDGGWAKLDELGNILGYVDTFSLLPGTYYLTVDGVGRPITFIDPLIHPGPVELTVDDKGPDGKEFTADDLPDDLSDWGYSDYGSLGYYSITGTKKTGLVVGVDFDTASGTSPLNWTTDSGGGASVELTDLMAETGFLTDYDLTISTTGASLQTQGSTNPIDPSQLPNHSLPLDELGGYITAEDGETLSFVWSDLTPDTVYQIFVFGHANVDVGNEVTVIGGVWNAETEQTFTQIVDANGIAVNGDNTPGGKDLTALPLLVISDEFGQITINVTNTEGRVVGIAGVAITTTEIGSLRGQKWNDNGGFDPSLAGNGGGSADPGEEGLPGWMVYLDLNNNGVLDMVSLPNRTIAQNAPEVPQVIPDAGAFVKNEVVIAESGIVLDVNVTMSITHGFVGDLNVFLVGPDGTRVKLVADRGGNGDHFTNTRFDDSAANSITTITSVGGPYTGNWRPEEPLSTFIGKEAAGKWTLEIRDDQFGFQGTLTAWSIEVEVEGTTEILEPFQITDAEGNYAFDALKAGLYYVREHVQEQQAIDGWRQSWAPPPVLVSSGAHVTGVDFGNWIPIFTPGAVAGQTWNDLNGDGEKDAGEPGLEGWTVYVDSNNNGTRDISTVPVVASASNLPKEIKDFSTVTSSIMVGDLGAILDIEVTMDITHSFMGDVEAYLTSPTGRIVELFTGVGAQFNDFQNVTFSDDAARSIATLNQDDVPYTGTWRPEVPLATFFGDEAEGLWTLTIRDTHFADEGTLNSWSISVTTGERFAITDADGNYEFANLPPGNFTIRQELQTGWQETYSPPISVDGLGNEYNVTVVGGTAVNANFGNQAAPGSIAGVVYNDTNGNGIKEGSESGLGGRTVYLDTNDNGTLDNDALISQSASGLPIAIPDASDDFPSIPSTITSQINVTSSLSITDVNVTIDVSHTFVQDLEIYLIAPWGERIALATQVGSAGSANFTNTTFDDQAATSITAATHPFTGSFRPEGLLSGLNGENSFGIWTLEISDLEFDDDGTLNSWSIDIRGGEKSTTTDVNGNYSFTDLVAGDYVVRQVLPEGWAQTTPADSWDIPLGAGQDLVARNFGSREGIPELLGDYNRDGNVDSADYLMVVKSMNTPVANAYDGADGNGNSVIDTGDMIVWQQNYGRTLNGGGGGSFSMASSGGDASAESPAESSPAAPVQSSAAKSSEAPAAATFSATVEQSTGSVASSITTSSAANSVSNGFGLFANSTRSSSSTAGAKASSANGSATVDEALIALLNALDAPSARLSSSFAADSFAGLGDEEELAGEGSNAIEGIDALFELIGA